MKRGDRVISRFGVLHRVQRVERGGYVRLMDGREFHSSEFRPYVVEHHGHLEAKNICDTCEHAAARLAKLAAT